MMIKINLPILLLFSSAALIAQSGADQQPKPQGPVVIVQTVVPAMSLACPISFRAQHGSGAGLLAAKDAPPTKGTSQMLHLVLTNPEHRQIAAANVTIHGLTDKARFVRVQSDDSDRDSEKTLNVRFPSSSGNERSADLLVPGFSAANFIELNSVTYSDGSTWKIETGNVCRVAVDGSMLISMH